MSNCVKVVFDRRKVAARTGKGKVELSVMLSNRQRKYVGVVDVTPAEWPAAKKFAVVRTEVARYDKILAAMEVLGEPITLETLNRHLGLDDKIEQRKALAEKKKVEKASSLFTDFMIACSEKEKLAPGTLRQKMVVVAALKAFGGIKKVANITAQDIRDFDTWLRETAHRTDVTLYVYHKWVRKYVRLAVQRGLLAKNPYNEFKISRGKSKERQPLTELELKRMRSLVLPEKMDRVRDLFIFSSYTGLAYCDMQAFDFKTMTERIGNMYYIDGSRIKTATKFFTPILAPAMEVLRKYNFKLPRISNQKGNEYLHLIERRMNLRKPLTFHVARHSFATLSLSHHVPIENVARMLGHTDIRTTQIYAKVLNENIAEQAENLARGII